MRGRRRATPLRALAALVLACPGAAGSVEASGLRLAADGRAIAEIRLAAGATETERSAARELAQHLSRVVGGAFAVAPAGQTVAEDSPAVLVGPGAAGCEPAPGREGFGPEEWLIRADGRTLVLCGGRPRGTLYAVYEFLERHVGVRWWTAGEEYVPRRSDLSVPRLEERGSPAFAYRDILLGAGSGVFAARSRLNGHFSRVPEALGGSEAYGPPHHAHTFYLYVPPEELFEEHPQYFAEVGGLRLGSGGQLCLSDPDLPALVARRMAREIEASRRTAAGEGVSPPLLFSFSQNDWARPCDCPRCRESVAREGAQSGPLVAFVNRLAALIGEEFPEVRVDTLAYQYTLDPPLHARVSADVVVRLSGLHQRDFSSPASDLVNAKYARAVEGWSSRCAHLRVWDYAGVFGDPGDLPLPNLRALAEDWAWYRQRGVEGLFLETDDAAGEELRELKLWVLAQLLSDPSRDLDRLVGEFARGYYGPAGGAIRRYLRALERARRAAPSFVGYRAEAAAYGYLGPDFIERAMAIFDRAERRVAGDAILLERVREARLSLDRAVLLRGCASATEALPRATCAAVARRYRETSRRRIEALLPAQRHEAELARVEGLVAGWLDGEPR